MEKKRLKYAIVTPARNEVANIRRTIQSVITQTHLPEKWVIVSDGSTDGTDEIVEEYLYQYPWIEFVRMPLHRDRQFAAKVQAFNAGYKKIKNIDYDIVGNLDADISFCKEYFEFLMAKFAENNELGVAGTPFVEDGNHYDYGFTNIEHVSGACQLFRRECFESIGGYVPIKSGGIDWVAVTTARMKGWKTRTFIGMTCFHHRKQGTGNSSQLMVWFNQGGKDYLFGNSIKWELFRVCYQMSKRPYLMGGALILSGYLLAIFKRAKKPIQDELILFIQKEQMERLKATIKKMFRIPITDETRLAKS